VVPAEEVEEAVGEQHRDLVEEALAPRYGLSPRGRDAHNDVAEDGAREVTVLPLAHREREHVGRAVLSTIDFVQLMHAIVVR
jgi:hypothetical protein